MFKRKIYEKMRKWKQESEGKTALLIEGARRIGTPEAKEYLYMMFGVMSYFVIAQAVNTTLVVGVFRSGGDTRFGLILDVSTMWGFSILLGAVAAFFLHASVPVVYILLMSDELVKLPLTLKRYRSYKWLKDVTRNNLEI